MVHKEYNSPGYYAQAFRDYVEGVEEDKKQRTKYKKRDIYSLLGTSFSARHHGEKVLFKAFGLDCVVGFSLKNDVPYASLEIYSKNGSSDSYEEKLKVNRSRKGRLNVEKTYVPFFENFIIPHLRKTLKK